MLRDLGRDDDQITAIMGIIATVDPDILLLTDFDFDLDGLALAAFADRAGYAHRFARAPNSGLPTGLDIDGNDRLGEARDAQGYGRFTGDGGLAIVSRWPVALIADHSQVLWRDVPGATWPADEPAAVLDIQRLSSTGHWTVRVETPDGPLDLMAWSATPPVFDGPEDRNGLRNRDELLFWLDHVAQADGPFVLLGNANLDPFDGDGRRAAMAKVLDHPRLQDPQQSSLGGVAAADRDHRGNPAYDTADWPDNRPGNLRVSYVLPSTDLRVVDAGVFWPAPDDPKSDLLGADGLAAGPHRLVWVDIAR